MKLGDTFLSLVFIIICSLFIFNAFIFDKFLLILRSGYRTRTNVLFFFIEFIYLLALKETLP